MAEKAHFINGHQLLGCILLLFVQRTELDICWSLGFISERRFKSIQIVCPYRYELAPSANILMQLVLKVDERVVAPLGELNIAQYCSRSKPSNLGSL